MNQHEKNIDITLHNYDEKKEHSVYYVIVNNYFNSRSNKVFMKVFPDFKISGYNSKQTKG